MADRLQTPVTTVSETQKKMGPTRLVRNLIFGWRLLLWVKLRTVVEPRQEVSNRRKHERFGVQTGYIHMFKLPEYPSKTSRKSTDSRRPFPSPQMSHPPYLVRAKRSNTLNVNSKSEHRQKKKNYISVVSSVGAGDHVTYRWNHATFGSVGGLVLVKQSRDVCFSFAASFFFGFEEDPHAVMRGSYGGPCIIQVLP